MSDQVILSNDVVRTMERLLTGQTDEALNDRFGISYNTWRKIKLGKQVRVSLANRLQSRLVKMDTGTHSVTIYAGDTNS